MGMHKQEFTASGAFTFNVPSGITAGWLTMIAGGAGGGGTKGIISTGIGGGGSGEFIQSLLVTLPSGGTVTGTIGLAGAGGSPLSAGHQGGGDGTVTTFGVYSVSPGKGGAFSTTGNGGGVNGGLGGNPSDSFGVIGGLEAPRFCGGAGGGRGSVGHQPSGDTPGYPGGGAAGYVIGGAGTSINGGGGGAASLWGLGGAGGNTRTAGSGAVANAYGAAGGGAGSNAADGTLYVGGAGRSGYVCVVWIA
jgi:hypothetical protein